MHIDAEAHIVPCSCGIWAEPPGLSNNSFFGGSCGNWKCEMVQRREGVRIHHPGGRAGCIRPLQRHPDGRLQISSGRGTGRFRDHAGAQGTAGSQRGQGWITPEGFGRQLRTKKGPGGETRPGPFFLKHLPTPPGRGCSTSRQMKKGGYWNPALPKFEPCSKASIVCIDRPESRRPGSIVRPRTAALR
jgi:hypothetical protein